MGGPEFTEATPSLFTLEKFATLQSALDPHGPDAAIAAEMAWVLIIGGALAFIAVMALAAYAVFARRERAVRLASRKLIVIGGIAFPAVVLAALLVYSLVRLPPLEGVNDSARYRIEVVAEQWWWRVHYLDAQGGRDFATANEIRIPVGEPVELLLKSADVLHSFWVPSLAGKLDMIPGRTQRLRLRADRPGEYRGQCAEYCGGPHGLMAFLVIAEDGDAHARWSQAQRREAAAPQGATGQTGARLFAQHCAGCHTIRGTPATGTLGPDLTHLASRRTLGAALLPLNAGTLSAWVASSQHLKPGNLMPSFATLAAGDLAALAAYLEGLG